MLWWIQPTFIVLISCTSFCDVHKMFLRCNSLRFCPEILSSATVVLFDTSSRLRQLRHGKAVFRLMESLKVTFFSCKRLRFSSSARPSNAFIPEKSSRLWKCHFKYLKGYLAALLVFGNVCSLLLP